MGTSEKSGFVYIMTNPSYPGMIKIGLTKETPKRRAASLSHHTGVPTDFIVIYDELVANCKAVESALHARFVSRRVNNRREFFWVPPKEAILALQELALVSPLTRLGGATRINLLPQCEARYRRWLRIDLVGLDLVQLTDIVYLEIAYQKSLYSNDLSIEREDLGVIYDGPDDEFPLMHPGRPPEANAKTFLELDTGTLLMCFTFFDREVYTWANWYEGNIGKELPFRPPSTT
ncbi:GIY-YIG nuclease family protein [Nonomuraea fuscirosea]|uniref:GIY-YIG nuclease family protein n=1 Tax=Nonomuraea fuscirosea TaxID=1291556 RepID=UPI00342C0661